MLFLFDFLFFLKLLFFFRIVKMTIYWIVIMGSPIFVIDLLDLLIYLFLHFLLVILFVNVIDDIEIFLVIVIQSFLPFNWKSNIPIFEVILWKLLIVNNIISVSDWTQLTQLRFRSTRVIGVEINNIETFLVLNGIFLIVNQIRGG